MHMCADDGAGIVLWLGTSSLLPDGQAASGSVVSPWHQMTWLITVTASLPENCQYPVSCQNKGIKCVSTNTQQRPSASGLQTHPPPLAMPNLLCFGRRHSLEFGHYFRKIKVINSLVLLLVKLKESKISCKHDDKELSIECNNKNKSFQLFKV